MKNNFFMKSLKKRGKINSNQVRRNQMTKNPRIRLFLVEIRVFVARRRLRKILIQKRKCVWKIYKISQPWWNQDIITKIGFYPYSTDRPFWLPWLFNKKNNRQTMLKVQKRSPWQAKWNLLILKPKTIHFLTHSSVWETMSLKMEK